MRRYVPPQPGPLARSRRDENDDVLDELFGPADTSGPGIFDVALIAAGAGLLAWGLVAAFAVLSVIGVLALLLGLVLPTRALIRRRGASGRRSRLPGMPLDTADPLVARFAAAYDAVFDSDQPGAAVARPAAHLAALEVASLLDGERISGPAQSAYVLQRVTLLEQVRRQLDTGRLGALDGSLDPREAEALGRLELEAGTHSSLEALRRLTRQNGEATP